MILLFFLLLVSSSHLFRSSCGQSSSANFDAVTESLGTIPPYVMQTTLASSALSVILQHTYHLSY